MTKYAIIDVETTGLMDFKRPADDPDQPRVAQFGMILWDSEDPGVAASESYYIQPDGWVMSPGAAEVNGLLTEMLQEHGVPIAGVLDSYVAVIKAGYVLVAFNAQFDAKMMRAELRRAGRDDLFTETPNICVMRACTDIVQAPSKNGRGFKFPKLAEACAHFGIANARQHDAMGDAHAAHDILMRLIELGALPEPAVHLAKVKPEGVAA